MISHVSSGPVVRDRSHGPMVQIPKSALYHCGVLLIMTCIISDALHVDINGVKTYPYEYASFARHLEMTEAASPASRAVQSKNM